MPCLFSQNILKTSFRSKSHTKRHMAFGCDFSYLRRINIFRPLWAKYRGFRSNTCTFSTFTFAFC